MNTNKTLINVILILDDDRNVCSGIKRRFEKRYQVRAVYSTNHDLAEALPALMYPHPDLILIDKIWKNAKGISEIVSGYDIGQKIREYGKSKAHGWLVQYYSSSLDVEEADNFLPESAIDSTWKKSFLIPDQGEPDWMFIERQIDRKGFFFLPV